MANPRKFSEKIALHNQKQAEETAAFEQIMREVMGATRTSHGQDNMQTYATSYDSSYIQQAANGAYPKHQLSISPSLGAYRGGSLPNVNQMSGGPAHSIDLQGALSHLEDMRHGREGGGPPSVGGAAASAGAAAMLPDRPHVRERGRHATAPHKGGRQMAFDKRADVSPYNSSLYLSPPPDTSWRRTNSDSALHQSAQAPQESFPGAGPSCGQRRGTDPVTARELDQMYRDCSARVDGFGQEILGLPDMNSMAMDNMNLKGYWDPKGGGGGDCYGNSLSNMGCGMSSHQQQQQHRPKSCDVPGINIYLPQDESGDGSLGAGSPNPSLGPQQQGMGHHPGNALQAPPPMGNGNTGSLPDLTSLHFPPPLATPLDPAEEMAQQQHQQSGQGPLPPLHPGNAGSPGSPRGCASPSGGRHASPGPAPSPSSRRRAHHNSTSMVLGQGGRLHGGPAPSGQQQPPQQQQQQQQPAVGAPGQVRAHSPLHQPPQQQRRHRPHPPRITVEGLTMDTNALSLDGYGGGSQQQQQQQQQQHQHQQQQHQHQQQQQQQQLGYYPPHSPQVLGQNPGSPLGYPPPSPTLPQTPTSPRPRQLYQGGAAPSDRSGGSAPASPVSHGASSPVSSPGAVGSPYGAGGYRAGSAMGSTSPLQQQMEQFRVATSTDDSTSPSAAATHNQYFVMPDGRYCSNPSIPTSCSSGGVFFSDMGPGPGGMSSAEALSCSLPYSPHDSLYYTGELQYSAKTAASPSSGGAPQTPQTPTSIPDIILTGPGTDDAALLKGALQQQAKLEGQSSLGSFDSADLFSAEEALRAGLDPIDIDGLQILTDPDMAVISDPAAEEAFRLDRS